jgi:hypothetical protein
VNIRNVLPLLAVCVLTSCETDRYQWNLSHAYVTPQTHLSRSDFEQIIQLVTHATVDPVGQISPQPTVRGRKRVFVDALSGSGPVQQFILEKAGSGWRIVSHEQSNDR